MKLKNIGALFSGALIAASLVACGGAQSSSAESGSATSAASGAASKTYIIATDTAFAPFEYAEADGNYKGIDIDILDAIAKDQKFEYKLNPVGFDAALQNVQAGQADGVIAGMSITDTRKQTFDFSDPYYDSTVCCAIPANSDVKSVEDLKGKNVAVKNGTQSQEWADSMKDQYGFTTVTFDTSDVMYQDVEAGNSAACFEDTPVMSYAISQYEATGGKEGKNFKIISEVAADSDFATPYGFAVNKGANAELLKMFNDGLANIKKDGTYDKIVNTYVKSTK